jgi:hypothetical protein
MANPVNRSCTVVVCGRLYRFQPREAVSVDAVATGAVEIFLSALKRLSALQSAVAKHGPCLKNVRTSYGT